MTERDFVFDMLGFGVFVGRVGGEKVI